jgi:outer membrane murein-binding lipoprotein Lpp
VFLPAAFLLLGLAGCTSSPKSDQSAAGGPMASSILSNAKDAQLRKRVEADHFPTAAQAGIQ